MTTSGQAVLRHPYIRATCLLLVVTAMLVAGWLWIEPGAEVRLDNYLPLHSFLEACSAIIAVLVFVVSRVAFGDQRNLNIILLGAAFLGVALLDFFHAQSYPGMPPLVTPSSPGKAIDFWLAGRFLAAGALLVAAFTSWDRTVAAGRARQITAAVMASVLAVVWALLYRPHWFPEMFAPYTGLTPFKVWCEVLIIAMSLTAALGYFTLASKGALSLELGRRCDPVALMAASLVTAAAETFLTVYTDVHGLFNVIGHLYKVIGAWFLYRGLVTVNLFEGQARSQLALAAADLATWTLDVGSGVVEGDERATQLFGLPSSSKAMFSDLETLIHPDDKPKRRAAHADALKPDGTGTYRCEFRIRRADSGAEQHILSLGRTEFVDGQPVRMIGIMRDVTDIKETESRLAADKQRLDAHMDNAPLAVIEFDADFRIMRWSQGAERMFGWTAADVLGLSVADFAWMHKDDADHIRQVAADLMSGRSTRTSFNCRNYRADGGVIHCAWYNSTIIGEQGRPVSHLSRVLDVTERKRAEDARKQAEDELARINTDLERRVATRTEALKEEMERRAEAERALALAQRLETIGRLARGLAHDFNNTLAAITANLSLAQLTVGDPKSRGCIKNALDAAEIGASLNRRLLTYARRGPIERATIATSDHIQAIVGLIERTLGVDIVVNSNLAPDLWPTCVDGGELDSAILNLALNSRDAMTSGGRLEIDARNVALEPGDMPKGFENRCGDYVTIEVRDNGSGMTPEVRGRAAEPFFTTKGATSGTGLGLSSVREFLRGSAGFMTIDSVPGAGTAVKLLLPRAELESQRAGSAIDPRDDLPIGDGELILLVDDDAKVLVGTCALIEGLGYAVVCVLSGEAALAEIDAGAPVQLVLSDIVMPGGMSGVDLAKVIVTRHRDIKVILASGYHDQQHALEEPERRDLVVLAKPYSRAQIAHSLHTALHARKQQT